MTNESPLRDLHPSGTAYQEIGDSTVAWSFGDSDAEYRSLRGTYGLLDHSSLGLIALMGDTEDLLNQVLARDVQYLTSEQCTTSLMLDDNGVPIDIVTLYGLEDRALVETSFGRGTATLEHLREHAGDVEVVRVNDERSTVGIEGPYAWGLVGRLIDQEFTALPYESTLLTEWEGHDILFARSGFTGEYGYKVIASHEAVRDFWNAAIQSTDPVGQETLEATMIEVRQPVFHLEATGDGNLLTYGWNWLVDLAKDDYLGREALQELIDAGPAVETVGFRQPGSTRLERGATVYAAGVAIGEVVHTVWSPAVEEWVGLARVQTELAAAGLPLTAGTNGERLPLRTATSPYVIPASWSVPVF